MAEAVKELRGRLGMSQRAFASRLGVPQSTVYRWESGAASPNGKHLQAIHELARLHGFPFAPFEDKEEEAEPQSPGDELSRAALRLLREQIAFCETLDRLKDTEEGAEVWRILAETVGLQRGRLTQFLDEVARDPARTFHFWKAVSVLRVFSWRDGVRREPQAAYVHRTQMTSSPDPYPARRD
jgi:transcriptional regulator with XRE-family HTH domain